MQIHSFSRTLKFTMLSLCFLMGLSFTSCSSDDDNNENVTGEGEIITKTLSVDNFTKLNLATSPNVTIKQGSSQEVKATGHENIIDLLLTDVSNDEYTIAFKPGTSINGNFQLSLEITLPDLNAVTTSSSGSVTIENFSDQDQLSLSSASSGSITLNQFEGIKALTANVSSSGNIDAKAGISSIEDLTISVSSNGSYRGFALSGKDCIVTVSSSGKVELTAEDTLDATLSSSGNVYYKGNPTITKSETSSGKVIDAN